jgi:hypothetical protein
MDRTRGEATQSDANEARSDTADPRQAGFDRLNALFGVPFQGPGTTGVKQYLRNWEQHWHNISNR